MCWRSVGGAAIFSRVWTAMIHVTRLFNQTNAGPMFRVTTWRTFLPCGLRVWTSWEPATRPEGPQKSSIPSHGRRCESLAEVAPGVQTLDQRESDGRVGDGGEFVRGGRVEGLSMGMWVLVDGLFIMVSDMSPGLPPGAVVLINASGQA